MTDYDSYDVGLTFANEQRSYVETVASHLRDAGLSVFYDEHEDVASASLRENWIDEAERRTWFLFGATRKLLSGAD